MQTLYKYSIFPNDIYSFLYFFHIVPFIIIWKHKLLHKLTQSRQ